MSRHCASLHFIHYVILLTLRLAWYAYEYLLTLPLEVEVIWKSKLNFTIILFLINRYTFLLTWALSEALELIITDATVRLVNIVLINLTETKGSQV